MDITAIYEYLLSRISEDLAPYGYKRSGKSTLFYRYSSDKKVGTAIEMQKSTFNSAGEYSFTFNIGCIALYNLRSYGYHNDKLTTKTLRLAFTDRSTITRLGILSRGYDFWWSITDEIVSNFPPEEYYDRFIHSDIIKGAEHLEQQAHKKESIYTKA